MLINNLKKSDKFILASVILLIILGLMTILSVSYSGNKINFLNFQKQLLYAFLGLVGMLTILSIDYRTFKNYTGLLYIITLILLVLVLIVGKTVSGMTGWFNLGFFNLQPSELTKPVMILVLAKYFSNTGYTYNLYKKIFISGLYIGIPIALISLQPDLGTAIVLGFIWFASLSMFGLRKKHFIICTALGVVASIYSWLYVFKAYQKKRIITFLNPQLDPLGDGYNVIQSIIAIGSGNIWGKGLGYGSQSQLEFLPAKHTDFIFAVISEELGFIGATLVIVLFSIIFWRLIKLAKDAQDNFGKLIALGALFMLLIHVFINIGMNLGITPVTGIPLPFISYGGTSLIAFLCTIGIVQSVYIHGRTYRLHNQEQDIL